ncbi:MAG: TlpA family protein disulfide reductase [Bacteroidia bacterium]|nr:TlpA family protein disulfide reductase [Bacteroidia bacterium]
MNIYHIKILFFILNISIIFSCKANNKFSDKAGLSDKSNYAIVIYETNNDNLHVYNTIFTDDLNNRSIMNLSNSDTLKFQVNDINYLASIRFNNDYEFVIPLRPNDTVLIKNISRKIDILSLNKTGDERQIEIDLYVENIMNRDNNRSKLDEITNSLNKAIKSKDEVGIQKYSNAYYVFRKNFADQFFADKPIGADVANQYKNNFLQLYELNSKTRLYKSILQAFPNDKKKQESYWVDILNFTNQINDPNLIKELQSLVRIKYGTNNTSTEKFNKIISDFSGKIRDALINSFFEEINNPDTLRNLLKLYSDKEFSNPLIIAGVNEKLNSIIVADSNKSIVLRDGERYILEELIHEKTNQDKILLINCWASWCMPCIAELKELIPELQKEINSDIEIIYLSIDTDLQSWNNAENKLGLNNSKDSYIVANKDIPYLISHQVEQVPTNFIYDKKGKLIKKIVGSVTIENIRAIINNVD